LSRAINSWLSAHDAVAAARNKHEGKPIGVETRVVVSRKSPTRDWKSEECVFAVRYHSTEVVRYYPNGDVGINPGDWTSKTTKARIRDHASASLWSSDGMDVLAWYPMGRFASIPIDVSKEYIIQRDGRLRLPDGSVLTQGTVRIRQPRHASPKRNLVMNPAVGEVLIDPNGKHFLMARLPEGKTGLIEYLGDYVFDRDYVFLGETVHHMTELFSLTLGEWTSGSRFVRSFDN